jgi:hypothetical protein
MKRTHRLLLEDRKGDLNSIIGSKIGKLTVLGHPFCTRCDSGLRIVYAVVQCDCGLIFTKKFNHIRESLKRLNTQISCKNCARVRQIKHGQTTKDKKLNKSQTRLYGIWIGMRHRCSKAKLGSTPYKKYIQKGIHVCPEWDSFEVFQEWAMNNGYVEENKNLIKNKSDRLSIDRIDPKLGYYPENCRWVSGRENSSNVAVERDKIIALQDIQIMWYEEYMLDNGLIIPDIKEIIEFKEINDLMNLPKPWTEENKKKILEYCNRN